MYFIYVSSDAQSIESLKNSLQLVDQEKVLVGVSNGYDLIRHLQNIKEGEPYPDLIILTTRKSRLNGKELLELLKSDDIYRLIPVIVFLMDEGPNDEVICQNLGADIILSPSAQKEWVD